MGGILNQPSFYSERPIGSGSSGYSGVPAVYDGGDHSLYDQWQTRPIGGSLPTMVDFPTGLGGGVDYSGGSNPSASFAPAPIQSGSSGGGLIQTLGKAAAFMPVVGTVGSLLLNGIGTYMDYKYKKDQQAKMDKWQEMQNAIAQRESAKKWQWAEEDRAYSKALSTFQNMMLMLDKNKQMENNLVTVWRGMK